MAMKRISKSVTQARVHYTVVVIGTGYGGGVAASRTARAGQSVCVLERGREILPGEYPNSLSSAFPDFQTHTKEQIYGSRTGMFDFRLGDDINVLLGCGLGGTSLINANVSLEMDPRIPAGDAWPKVFRDDSKILSRYYQRAREVLAPTPYPDHFPTLNKLEALEVSAKAMDKRCYRPPINVNFEDCVNPFGVEQAACTLCGDCTSGCNYGAKNTTLMNYLPDAHNHGAEIFTCAQVTYIERDNNLWNVHVECLDDPRNTTNRVVTADIVMLGAGSLGSTEILLRSAEKGLALSDQLGKRFSCNGDVLGFGYNNDWKRENGERVGIYGVGAGTMKPEAAHQPGPCIAGVIDMRDTHNVADGLVIEEGVLPGALASAVPAAFFFASALEGEFTRYMDAKDRLLDAQQLGQVIQEHPGDMVKEAYRGPVSRTQTYLVMSCDSAGGEFKLENDRLQINWPGAGRASVYRHDDSALREANRAVRGIFVPNPIWSQALDRRVVTVHPIGGCAMADDGERGVVDHRCRVFDGSGTAAVHDGLYVCDGAVMPAALGVNPSFTIAAVAERACDLLAQDRGWTIDYNQAERRRIDAPPAAPAATPSGMTEDDHARHHTGIMAHAQEALATPHLGILEKALHALKKGAGSVAEQLMRELIDTCPDTFSPGLSFRERMAGYFCADLPDAEPATAARISDPYAVASKLGQAAGMEMVAQLEIATDDLNELISNADHAARASGEIVCKGLSATPMTITEGRFQLLVTDPNAVETWRMQYRLHLHRNDKTPLFLHGDKIIRQRQGSNWWTDVTTLFVDVYETSDWQKDDLSRPVGRGLLKLGLDDLVHQSNTVKLDPAAIVGVYEPLANAVNRLYLAKFAGFFAGIIFRAYGGLLSDLADFPAQDDAKRPRRVLRAPAPETHRLKTSDGVELKLTRYCNKATKGPLVLAPGFGMPASSFAVDTTDTNIVEYLTENGYDLWLFDYRASPALASATQPFNIDDIALYDWPIAIETIRKITGAPDVQALVHCVGSMSFLMALLKGLEGIRAAVCSQLTLHPITNWENNLKADLHLTQILERYLGISKIGMTSSANTEDKTIDAMVWNVPVPPGEACKNPVCHRVFSIYGPVMVHDQLNHMTHIAMREMFGTVGLKPFEHLSAIMRKGHVVDVNGDNSYLPHVKKLNIPLTFLAGARNQIFFPETSERTLEWLRSSNPEYKDWYSRHVFTDYAHLDLFVGRNAVRDIYPMILELLDAHARVSSPA